MALLGQKLDDVIKRLDTLDDIERHIGQCDIEIQRALIMAANNKSEIDRLRSASNIWDVITGVMAIIGATVAAILGRQS